MKKPTNVAMVLVTLVVMFLGGATASYYFLDSVHADRDALLRHNTERLMEYVRRDQRIEDMTDVLVNSYDLDRIRAYYYCVFFEELSRKYGIDWEWYAALMRMESNFVATAKSKSRPPAKGLMQLQEKTFKTMCDSLDISYQPDTTIWDDIANMLCGAHYFSLHARENDPEHGVRVYLGGPDYMRTIKASREHRKYVKEYSSTTEREYCRLKMAYEGVRARKNRSKEKSRE